jgi:hypothetical protein
VANVRISANCRQDFNGFYLDRTASLGNTIRKVVPLPGSDCFTFR